MTDKIKGLVEAAEKAHTKSKDERIEQAVKEIVQDTLEKIGQLETKIEALQEEKKQLKATIDDLKAGNLKLLKEKLDKDQSAKSVVHIRIVETQPIYIEQPRNPWFTPWTVWYGDNCFTTNSSEVKNATLGTYCLSSGSSVTLR